MAHFTIEKTSTASPQAIFEVITDHTAYPEFTPGLRKARMEREGDPAPNGLGAIRVLSAVGPPMREEIVAFEPPSKFSYKLLSGLPLKDHIGTVAITPNGEG